MAIDNEDEEAVAAAMGRVLDGMAVFRLNRPKAPYSALVKEYRKRCQEEGLHTDFQGWTSELDEMLEK